MAGLLFLYPLLIGLLLHSSSADSLFQRCGGRGNYTTKSTYQSNLNHLLTFFTSLNSTFSNHTQGSDPDTVYGLFLCRGDVSPSDCSNCVQNAAQDVLSLCPSSKQAYVWYDNCELGYSNLRFFGTRDSSNSHTPQPSSPPPTSSTSTGEGNMDIIIISTVISIVIVFLVIFSVRIFFRRRSAWNSHGTANPEVISSAESLYFDLSVLKVATDNFSDANKLGQGGFGAVYKGILPHGEAIAVKRLSAKSRQGIEELKNELLLVAKLQHKNLVRLQGVCLEEGEKLLVYEYMSNGSLDKFLIDPTKRRELNWERRFKIIGGIARGLLYLHEESHLKVIHRDIKASNVLLDANMKPKISDFGLARLLGEDDAITCRVVGTFGYMAPEYARCGRFSTKLDVYSYGIVVLEIVTGRKNSTFKYDSDHGQDLLSYAWKHYRSGTALEIIDKSLGEDYSRTEAFQCIQIGLFCAQEVPGDRPSMSLVSLMLNSPSTPLQDPLPPAYLAGSSAVEADVS